MIVNKRFINRVRKLTEIDNMTIKDIAQKMECSVATIKRVRKQNNIVKKNNGVKTKYICCMCGGVVYIYRCENKRLMCPECRRKMKKGGEFKNETL